MKQYDVTCPVCGCLNERLYLEETAGVLECRKCLQVTYLSMNAANMFPSNEKKIIRTIVQRSQLQKQVG